jgi:hypothetical protein
LLKKNRRLPIFKKSFDRIATKKVALRILFRCSYFPAPSENCFPDTREQITLQFFSGSSCHQTAESRKIAVRGGGIDKRSRKFFHRPAKAPLERGFDAAAAPSKTQER